MAHLLTTKELSRYLKLHEITITKYASQGLIPAIRVGRVWRFDKDKIDEWEVMRTGQNGTKADLKSKGKGGKKDL